MSGTYILFACLNLNQLCNWLLSKVYCLGQFSTDDIITSLNIYSICLIYFMPFMGFLFSKSQGSRVDSYWVIKACKDSTCVQLCITFKFTVVSLRDCILLNIYIVASHICWIYQHIFCGRLRFSILFIVPQYNLL